MLIVFVKDPFLWKINAEIAERKINKIINEIINNKYNKIDNPEHEMWSWQSLKRIGEVSVVKSFCNSVYKLSIVSFFNNKNSLFCVINN